MSEELKPCPFCGGNPKMYKWALFSCEAQVVCQKCRAQTKLYKEASMELAKHDAIHAWNRRVTE